jgi:hypothetical protein
MRNLFHNLFSLVSTSEIIAIQGEKTNRRAGWPAFKIRVPWSNRRGNFPSKK